MAPHSALAFLLSLLGILLLAQPGAAVRDEDDAAEEDRQAVHQHSVFDLEAPSSAAETGDLSAERPPKKPKMTDRDRKMMETYGAIKPKRKVKIVRRRRKKAGKKAAKVDGSAVQDLVPVLQVVEAATASKPAQEKVEIVDQLQQEVETVVDEEEEEMPPPEDFIAMDPCCLADSSEVAAAESASPGGTYTVTVKHSGLSLSASGEPGTCASRETSMVAVSVEYLCPQQCFVNPLTYQNFVELMERQPDSTVADVEDCFKNQCNGQCYNPHAGSWHWGSVVSVAAPRLRGCTVVGGGDDGRVVMTTSCKGSFEEWRQLYWQRMG